jgi:hypothetical protein
MKDSKSAGLRPVGVRPPSRHQINQKLTSNGPSSEESDFGYSLPKLQNFGLACSSKTPSPASRRSPTAMGLARFFLVRIWHRVCTNPDFQYWRSRWAEWRAIAEPLGQTLLLATGPNWDTTSLFFRAVRHRFDRDRNRPQSPTCSHWTASSADACRD